MKQFIPYEKLSKRERKIRGTERRVNRSMSPVTRRPVNPNAYNRKGYKSASMRSHLCVFLYLAITDILKAKAIGIFYTGLITFLFYLCSAIAHASNRTKLFNGVWISLN